MKQLASEVTRIPWGVSLLRQEKESKKEGVLLNSEAGGDEAGLAWNRKSLEAMGSVNGWIPLHRRWR